MQLIAVTVNKMNKNKLTDVYFACSLDNVGLKSLGKA